MFHLSRFLVQLVLGFFLLLISALLGYFIIYGFTFSKFNSFFETLSYLKNQVTEERKTTKIKEQLRNLGYQFQDTNFYQLNTLSSTHYKANVLDGYEPIKESYENKQSQGYYFYDDKGEAFYFILNDKQTIHPDQLIRLNRE